jgi:hypothetical protein
MFVRHPASLLQQPCILDKIVVIECPVATKQRLAVYPKANLVIRRGSAFLPLRKGICLRDDTESLSKRYCTAVKTINKNPNVVWLDTEQLDALREELHRRIALEELENSWRMEGLDRIIALFQMDPAAFHREWVQPLLAAGASVEVAYACIAESCFRPN